MEEDRGISVLLNEKLWPILTKNLLGHVDYNYLDMLSISHVPEINLKKKSIKSYMLWIEKQLITPKTVCSSSYIRKLFIRIVFLYYENEKKIGLLPYAYIGKKLCIDENKYIGIDALSKFYVKDKYENIDETVKNNQDSVECKLARILNLIGGKSENNPIISKELALSVACTAVFYSKEKLFFIHDQILTDEPEKIIKILVQEYLEKRVTALNNYLVSRG